MQERRWLVKRTLRFLGLGFLLCSAIVLGFDNGQVRGLHTQQATLLWTYTIPNLDPNFGSLGVPSLLAPTLGVDGTLYVNANGNLYALTPNGGRVKWVRRTDALQTSTVAVGKEGNIYTASSDAVLAFHADGSPKWTFPLLGSNALFSSPLSIGADGTIHVSSVGACSKGDCDFKLFWINPDGSQQRVLRGGVSGMAIGADDTIYAVGAVIPANERVPRCTTPEGCLAGFIALTPQGSVRWVLPMNGDALPAIGADGTLYVPLKRALAGTPPGIITGQLAAVSPDGTVKWILDEPESLMALSSPITGPDGTIYIVLSDGDSTFAGYLYAITPNGQITWSYKEYDICAPIFASPAVMTPLVGADGTIYVGTCDNVLNAVNPDGTLQWSFQIPMGDSSSGIVYGLVMNENGTIYFLYDRSLSSINEWVVYAISSSSRGLAASSWPMFQHDPQHTGRASP